MTQSDGSSGTPESKTAPAPDAGLVTDAFDDGHIAVAADDTVTGWNKAAMAKFGWSSEDVIGVDLLRLDRPC